MTLPSAVLNPISRIDPPAVSLSAVAVTGAGSVQALSRPCKNVSMQVSFTGGSPTVKVNLQGSIDGSNWFTLVSFDTGSSNVSGDVVGAATITVLYLRANVATLSGGTSPTVTATVLGSE